MPKKKTAKPELVRKIIKIPADWVARIDECRGDVSFSDFVRQALLVQIGEKGLSEVTGWGLGRWKSD